MTTELVREFHEKHGFSTGCDFDLAVLELRSEPVVVESLRLLSQILEQNINRMGYSRTLFETRELRRAKLFIERIMLTLEEVSELVESINDGDQINFCDSLADIHYVNCGTAVAFGIPLEEAVEIVHRSNMTKKVGAFKPEKDHEFSDPEPALAALLIKTREDPESASASQMEFDWGDK